MTVAQKSILIFTLYVFDETVKSLRKFQKIEFSKVVLLIFFFFLSSTYRKVKKIKKKEN